MMQQPDYCQRLGWYLVAIPAGTKGPTTFGWQKPERAISDPEQAREYFTNNPTHNVGLLHGPSGTCAIDVDHVENTKIIFEALGIDYEALLNSAPRIVGRQDRAKVLFKAPDGLGTHKISWPVQGDPRKTEVVFELRAGAVQDVLPPSIHPDTQQPYTWAGQSIWDGLPELPTQILTIWQNWDKFRPQLMDLCPWAVKPTKPPRKTRPIGDRTSVIEAFNAQHDIGELLTRYGYKKMGRDRFLSPNSSSGLAGVNVFEDNTAYSHHASDPFDSAHAFDCFELWCQYEYMGDVSKAVKDAAGFLHIENEPDQAFDAEAIEHGAKVAAQIFGQKKKDRGPLEGIPEHLLSVPGVLQDVVNLYETTAIKPQPQFAVQSAIAFGSVVMGRRWVTDQDNYSSLYFLNIGDTGCGKEHGKKVLERLLEQAQLSEYIGPAGYTSSSGAFSALIHQPVHLTVMDELGKMLKTAGAKGNHHKQESLTLIMEVFGRQSGTLRPVGFSKMGRTQQEAAELDKVVKHPSLTLFGMSTGSEFYSAIGGGDVASGFLNRFLIVKTNIGIQKSRRIRNVEGSDRLISWARDHATATAGDLDASSYDLAPAAIVVPFTDEALDILDRFEDQIIINTKKEGGSGLEAMFNRNREMAMRLSLIIARSLGASEVTAEAMQWSVDYVGYYSDRTIDMFRENMSDGSFEAACKSVYAKIKSAGLGGLSEREIARGVSAFRNMPRKQRNDILDAVSNDYDVTSRNANEGKPGRPKFVWYASG